MSGNAKVSGRITIPSAEQAELIPLIEEHARLSRAEPGCLRFQVSREVGDAGTFPVSEPLVDRAASSARGERTSNSERGLRSGSPVRKPDRTISG